MRRWERDREFTLGGTIKKQYSFHILLYSFDAKSCTMHKAHGMNEMVVCTQYLGDYCWDICLIQCNFWYDVNIYFSRESGTAVSETMRGETLNQWCKEHQQQ